MSIENFIKNLEIAPATSHLNLMMHPLVSRSYAKPNYLMLDDALQTGRFRVEEVSFGGSVPELKVLNDLSQPVLLLDGEELVGAKQNRVLNLTIMVPAASEVAIPVSCVEAGRWSHVSDSFAAADRAQFARGRAKKLAQVSHSLRAAGSRNSDQADVWNEIEMKRARMGAESPTSAMASLYEDSRVRLNEFIAAMPNTEGQVGAVFLINGQIAGIDIFDTAPAFAKSAAKLIRSYAIDALDSPRESVASEPGIKTARTFLNDIAAANCISFKAIGIGDDVRFSGQNLGGAALQIAGRIIHLVAFPNKLLADGHRHDARPGRMARARIRRSYH